MKDKVLLIHENILPFLKLYEFFLDPLGLMYWNNWPKLIQIFVNSIYYSSMMPFKLIQFFRIRSANIRQSSGTTLISCSQYFLNSVKQNS
ncbi:hypothetical protein DERP_012458 [Dermatophagoides pteronyssinus]|uniref:Uncharacterized protein n=1 Tax=Dermatophagoides pteronyssinus TaxID=6956 RepID=A0ABQ8IX37_DERPT|nr:hypothetical protein DERP_012458 [Dermatophagoides pteronyssinus]